MRDLFDDWLRLGVLAHSGMGRAAPGRVDLRSGLRESGYGQRDGPLGPGAGARDPCRGSGQGGGGQIDGGDDFPGRRSHGDGVGRFGHGARPRFSFLASLSRRQRRGGYRGGGGAHAARLGVSGPGARGVGRDHQPLSVCRGGDAPGGFQRAGVLLRRDGDRRDCGGLHAVDACEERRRVSADAPRRGSAD